MAAGSTWQDAARRLTAALHLDVAPIAITFSNTAVDDAPPFADPSAPMPEPTADGRTGRVPAGRHALTARAVDALGRWAGASVLVDIPARGLEPDAAA